MSGLRFSLKTMKIVCNICSLQVHSRILKSRIRLRNLKNILFMNCFLSSIRSESVVSSSSVRKSLKKKSSSSSNGKKENDSDRKENDAAKTIQRNWRNHRREKLKMEVFNLLSNLCCFFFFFNQSV